MGDDERETVRYLLQAVAPGGLDSWAAVPPVYNAAEMWSHLQWFLSVGCGSGTTR